MGQTDQTSIPATTKGERKELEEHLKASLHLAYTMAGTPEPQPRPNSIPAAHVPQRLHTEPQFGLYNGVSNRSRGWKSKASGQFMDNRTPSYSTIKRWDGTSKTWQPWDNLRKDPELWYRNGDCFVHLYDVGQSRRGPAFKVPFSSLLAARCHPLLDRFLAHGSPNDPSIRPQSIAQPWPSSNGRNGTQFDLYIPAPLVADKDQAFFYHLTTRNFFAWVLRKPLVGKDLGNTMIALLSTMTDFRCHAEDNVQDLLAYLDDMRYLDMRNQPHFALAILHLAEYFQLRDLYIDAFAHCTGMCDRLFLSPEYQHVSSVSRKLIRRAKADMDTKLNAAGLMLGTFLYEELSDTNLGLPPAARAHLDRFRAFLHAFYANKLGLYPPPPIDRRGFIFKPAVYSLMRDDFECLYRLLVDESFNTAQDSPFVATGGICTLQCVQSFDLRHKFVTLDQPMPLLPDIPVPAASRRKSWLGRSDKTRPDQRLVAHAALLKASNMDKSELLENSLVHAYRKFEEDFVLDPTKVDKAEKVSQEDARKVRWILVYAMYQTLRSVTEPPAEVRETHGVPYHLAISTDILPPWREDRLNTCSPHLGPYQTPCGLTSRSRASSVSGYPHHSVPPLRINTEIKPDVDHFALAHRQPATTQNSPLATPTIPSRSRSLTRGFSHSGSMRRSLRIFSKHSRSSSPPAPLPKAATNTPPTQKRRPSYHEIVIHGYGNGLNSVHMATEYIAGPLQSSPIQSPIASANRSLSNASKSSDGSATSAGTASTTPSSASSIREKPPYHSLDPNRCSSLTITSDSPRGRTKDQKRRASGPSGLARALSACSSNSRRYSTATFPKEDTGSKETAMPNFQSPKDVKSGRFRTIGGYEDLMFISGITDAPRSPRIKLSPLRIQKDFSNLRQAGGEWDEVNQKRENQVTKPVWDQFADLGGHTKMD